ncbi:SF3a splicing factor complex subunit [Mycoemilia scoparia]|uniref:SF3a splicing factor complex subunit n=1 Tax=Mycoemilia scoparia TaxID=417184 RepID=A0A9W8DRI8_9FUNG|nr:SF3a splicing factor complex subunit [Mycoemilia scoparia]
MVETQATATSNGTDSTTENLVIYPPPEIRKIIDKTAAFVGKAGKVLEDRVRESEKGNPKFSFLSPNDPYHAYYVMKLNDVATKKPADKSDKDSSSSQPKKDQTDKENKKSGNQADTNEEASGSSTQNNNGEPAMPPPFDHIFPMPSISAEDLDVIRLTAQFVARNGRQFLISLSQREKRNCQFDFLHPTHSLFPYFTRLMDAYTKVLAPDSKTIDQLSENVKNKAQIIDSIKQRAEWEAYTEAKRKLHKEQEDERQRLYQSIDWHDFVVVGTVEFVEEDEKAELALPLRLQDLKNMSLTQKGSMISGTGGPAPTAIPSGRLAGRSRPDESKARATTVEQQEADDDVDMDEADDMDMEDAESGDDETHTQPSGKKQKEQPIHIPANVGAVKIRKDYVPKLLGTTRKTTTQVCPLCRQAIPDSQFDEHIRIELLDPRWKEQKDLVESRMRENNTVRDETNVARYLKQMMAHRSDIYDGQNKDGDNQDPTAIGAKPKKIVAWDGFSSTADETLRKAKMNMSIEDQIATIHRNKGLITNSSGGMIGPHVPVPQPPPGPPPPPSIQEAPGMVPVPGMTINGPLPLYPAPMQSSLQGATSVPIPPPGITTTAPVAPATPEPNLIQPPSGSGIKREASDGGSQQADAKRPKEDSQTKDLIPATKWAERYPGPIDLIVQVPNIPEQTKWKLQGQTLTFTSIGLDTTISDIKDMIHQKVDMPVGKQKLTLIMNNESEHPSHNTVAKNQATLADYNFMSKDKLALGIKERGGRR